MPNALSARRIETARLRRGLTQAAVARELDITARTYRKYEQEGAPAERLEQLANTLGFPAEFFTRDSDSDLDANDVSFRAGRRAPVKAKAAAVAIGRCGLEVDEYLQQRFIFPDLDLPDLAGHSPRQAARLLRDHWSLSDAPLPNLVQLCESRGIRVYGLPPSAYAVDAYSHWYDGNPFIFLARRRTPEGVRFDIAHEIGHLVMHSHSAPTPELEPEADEFASEFLLPRTALAAYLPAHPGIDDILRVRTGYRTSAMAVAVAAHRAGRLTDSAYRRMCTTLGKKGFRTSEPGGMSAYEGSRVFATVFSNNTSTKLTPTSISADLALPLEDVYALTLSTRLHAIAQPPHTSPPTPQPPSTGPSLRLVR